MIKRCKCLIKKGIMTEFRQCRLKEKHGRSHVPDLTDMTFNNYTVLSFAGSNIHRSNYWWTIDSFGVKRKIKASNLYRGIVKGLRVPFGHCNSMRSKDGKNRPEYNTVFMHHKYIFKDKSLPYKDMPFYDDWNPDRGGKYKNGMRWIIENLGERPGNGWSLDIIKHNLGFVPGNLRWALRNQQSLNKQHRFLGQLTDEEFVVEAKRRGFLIQKASL